jgi:hypothetical protein
MASLDNLRDALEIAESQNINYVLVSIQKDGNKGQNLKFINFDWIEEEQIPSILEAMAVKMKEISQRMSKKKK